MRFPSPHKRVFPFAPTDFHSAYLTSLLLLSTPVLLSQTPSQAQAPSEAQTPSETPALPQETETVASSESSSQTPFEEIAPPGPLPTPVPTPTPAPTSTATPAPVTVPITGRTAPNGKTLPLPAPQPARIFADNVRYEGGTIIAESEGDKGVRLESEDAQGQTVKVWAKRIQVDTTARTLRAQGDVRVERTRIVQRRGISQDRIPQTSKAQTLTETLRGQNFQYDFKTRQGSLDTVRLQMASFDVSADSLSINGRRYTALTVVLRPGGLTEEERKIYGTPPFSIRARSATYDMGLPQPSSAISTGGGGAGTLPGSESGSGSGTGGANTANGPRVTVKGAGLYFKNLRLLPIPGYVFRRLAGGPREEQAYTLTPRLSVNSVDGVLVTTKLVYPLSTRENAPVLNADIGLSARIGLRGGLSLEQPTRFGSFELSARKNDIVTAKLTNRIVLDRLPELSYSSPTVPLFKLPGNRLAGFKIGAGIGRFSERTIGDGGGEVEARREQGVIRFTTRAGNQEGPYLDLFARMSRYSNFERTYRNAGFETGYAGQLLPRVRGIVSYSSTSSRGGTPFRFDEVDIERELRTTFDVTLTPRYLLPIDLRYDLGQRRFRDQRFGILRNYKTFAYGFSYSTAREELRFELRQGF